MYEALVKRLREWPRVCVQYDGSIDQLHDDAADAIEELQNLIDAQLGIIKQYQEYLKESTWIPVTERLPEDRHDVLVYAGVMFSYITVGYYDGLWKFSYNDEEIAGSADYWMPLPTPPKEET